MKYFNFKELPVFIIWVIWNHKNTIIFEDKKINFKWLCNKIIPYFKDFWKEGKQILPRRPSYFTEIESYLLGNFDGVSQSSICGGGMFL